MTAEERLASLEGRWRLVRAVRHADGRRARLRGEATWRPDGAGLACKERGRLEAGGASVEAVRATLWRVEEGRLVVRLPSGDRLCEAAERWERHVCGADAYLIRHGWALWPRWTLRWDVRGPRKRWRALSVYEPVTAARRFARSSGPAPRSG